MKEVRKDERKRECVKNKERERRENVIENKIKRKRNEC